MQSHAAGQKGKSPYCSLAFGSARSGEFHELPTVDLALFEILIKDYSSEPKGAFE